MIKENEITSLKSTIAELQEKIAALLKENQELREKLNTNSTNSSLPPSGDPNRKKRPKKGSGRRAGGQPGHRGYKRRLAPESEVQKFVKVLPQGCPNCGEGTLDTERPVNTERRQQIELPEIKPEITQFDIHTCRCNKCGKHVAAAVPPEARKGFGPRLMGFLIMLGAEAKATRSVIVRLLGHLGISISAGSVSNVQKLAAELLAAPYEEIKKATLAQPHLNADETSWQNQGKRRWIWVAAGSNTVFFQIDLSRSQAAFQRVFGDYKGALTTDRYGAYNVHEGEKQCCWSHLDRDFAKMAEREGMDGFIGRTLQEQADALFGLWRTYIAGQSTRDEMLSFAERELIPKVQLCLRAGAALEEVQAKTKATCYDLLARFQTLWLFLYREGVEPTNNRSERELRPAVIRRKISLFSYSEWGDRFVERILTITSTLRHMSKNVFAYFTACFQAWQRDGPIPSPFS